MKPYRALAVQAGWPYIIRREDIKRVAIPHLKRLTELAFNTANWELPIKLIAYPEGALSGWAAGSGGVKSDIKGHLQFCREMAAESVPGEETELLGEIAKTYNVYLIATMKACDPEVCKDRYFTIAFLINPRGELILKFHKLFLPAAGQSVTPHDVWDTFVAKYGDGPDAFFKVADTEIGRIGLSVAMDGGFAELYRGLALQGAEIVYRPSYIEPLVSRLGRNVWEIQNRARAIDNCFYMICPNDGPVYQGETIGLQSAYNWAGGRSMIVDYKGQVLFECEYATEGHACALINIEELRDWRDRNPLNSMPLLRTEYFRKLYEKPIYPKNIYLDKAPGGREEFEAEIMKTIRKLQEQGIYLPPSK